MQPPTIPPTLYCPGCGERLQVLRYQRGLLEQGRVQMNLRCLRCGRSGGVGGVALTSFGHEAPLRNPVAMALWRLLWWRQARRSRKMGARLRAQSPFLRSDMTVDFADLVGHVPLLLYGLRGHPLGLRFTGPGWGGAPGAIRHVDLDYVVGPPDAPAQALHLVQEAEQPPASAREIREQGALRHLVMNHGPRRPETVMFGEWTAFNRDWNLERIRQAWQQQTILEIAGRQVEVTVTSWEEPLLVHMARFALEGQEVLAASLAIPWEDLGRALGTLVALQGDAGAVAEHQQDLAAVARELRGHHKEGPAASHA